jgi:hypothetical protein
MIGLYLWLLGVAMAVDSQDVTLAMSLSEQQAGAQRLVVSVEYPVGSTVDISRPVAQGLEFNQDKPVFKERIDARVFEVHEYAFSGSAGSYEVLPLTAEWVLDGVRGSASSHSLFIDHQVEATPPGELVDIVEPDIRAGTPWLDYLGAAGFAWLFAMGIFYAFRGKPSEDEEEEEDGPPPHEMALARWKAVLADQEMSVEEKAIELSSLFRDYLEAQLRFPATAWTTTESMKHLSALAYLDPKLLQGAKRILRATDWVKYAEASTPEESLRSLDSDLLSFIEATKPRSWEEEP